MAYEYMRGLLHRTELFQSVRDPTQDPIPSRGPLSELMPLIKSKWAFLETAGPLKQPYDGAHWGAALVSKNPSYLCTENSQSHRQASPGNGVVPLDRWPASSY